jgi:hypothetical protein
MQIRKQVYDLTPEDLDAHPAWQFALDEEGQEGQDEATVRPVEGPLDPSEGMCIAKAEFTLNDGCTFVGFLTPSVQGLPKLFQYEGDDGSSVSQPSIVTPHGHVPFWYGVLKPSPQVLADAYRILGARSALQVFPTRYRTVAEITTGEVTGEIRGFMYIEKVKRGFFKRVQQVRFVVE